MKKILLSVVAMLVLLGLTFIEQISENTYILIPCVFITFLIGISIIIQIIDKNKKDRTETEE